MDSEKNNNVLGLAERNSNQVEKDSTSPSAAAGSSSSEPNSSASEMAEAVSGWKSFCTVLATISFFIAGLGLLMLAVPPSVNAPPALVIFLSGLSSGISLLLLGYLIQLLFECRNYLRDIARTQTNLRVAEKASIAAPKA